MPKRSVVVRIDTISHPSTAEVIFAVKAELLRVGVPSDVMEHQIDPNQVTSISDKGVSLAEMVARTMELAPSYDAYIHINNAHANYDIGKQSSQAHLLLAVSAGARAPYRFNLLVDEDADVPAAVLRTFDAQAVLVTKQLPLFTAPRDLDNAKFVDSMTDFVCGSIFRWSKERWGFQRPN